VRKNMSNKIKELLNKFNLTEEEYEEARYNLTTSSYYIYKEIEFSDVLECSILYFDSDDGVAIIKATAEIFEEEGFSIELIDCKYCDIRYEDMKEIINICENFEILADKLIQKEIEKEFDRT